jgi:hypothetical protein
LLEARYPDFIAALLPALPEGPVAPVESVADGAYCHVAIVAALDLTRP